MTNLSNTESTVNQETKGNITITLETHKKNANYIDICQDNSGTITENEPVALENWEEDGYEKTFLTEEEKDDIALNNQKLVYYVAHSFRNTGIDLDELISVGMLGYAKAINSFDTKRNVKFSTYAITCIQNEIRFFLRKENKHRAMSVSMQKTLSTDPNGNSFDLEDIMQDIDIENVSDDMMIEERKDLILKAIKRLPPKEQYIILHRYGLMDGKKRTQKVIARQINMSQANVSKLQKTSLEKLKRYLRDVTGDRTMTLEEALEL